MSTANPGGSPRKGRKELNLGRMTDGELEEILIDLLIVKYPGIESTDIARLLQALDAGDLEQVEQAEADLAEKSAQWKLAALDLDV